MVGFGIVACNVEPKYKHWVNHRSIYRPIVFDDTVILARCYFYFEFFFITTGFISAPSYAFAGVTFPYIAISDSAQYWSNALPLTHYLKLHIAQLQMQAPIAISLPIVYGLMLAAIIALLFAALLTKRALAHPERWGAR